MFHASIKSRVCLMVPFPMTDALSQSNAWPVVRQCGGIENFNFVAWWRLCVLARCQPVWHTLAMGQPEHGMWYTTFRCFTVGSFTFTSVPLSDFVGLWAVTKLRDGGVGQSARKHFYKINVHDKIVNRWWWHVPICPPYVFSVTFILLSLLYIVIFHTVRFPMLIDVNFYS